MTPNNDIPIQLLEKNSQIQKDFIKTFKKDPLFFLKKNFDIFSRDKERRLFTNTIPTSEIGIQFSRCDFASVEVSFESFATLNKKLPPFFSGKIIFLNMADREQSFDNNTSKKDFFGFDQFGFSNSR